MPPRTKTEMEKKIEELEEKQAELQKQIDELKQVKIEEPPRKRWKPKIDETYYYLHSFGIISSAIWDNNGADNWRYLTGNVFETEQEAEEHKKKLKIQARFRNFVEERSEELNWEDVGEEKWHIYYSVNDKTVRTDYNLYTKCPGVIYASSEQILENAIAEIGEENIKKYILEVE